MHTTSGLLSYLTDQGLGARLSRLVALLVVAAVIVSMVAVVALGLFEASPEPVLTAPVRWLHRV